MKHRLATCGLWLVAVMILLSLATTESFAAEKNIVRIGANVDISPTDVVSDVVVIDGDVRISGKVDNTVVVIGGSLKLNSGAYIGQQIVLIGASLDKDPSAKVGGKITEIDMPSFIPLGLSLKSFFSGGWVIAWAAISAMVLLGFLGLAILIAALIPEHIGSVVNALEKSFASMFLWGILWAFLAGLTIVLLAITIIGIILIPLAVIIITLAWIIGYIASAVFIGRNVMVYFKKKAPAFVDAVLGIILLFLAGLIPLVGPLIIKPIFLFAGFGAVLTTRFGTLKRD